MSAAFDPAQLAAIADLKLLARTAVAGLGAGIHRSAKTGTAAEFAQYRPYTPGDDPRFVDWRLWARSDRLHIKQFSDETNLRCTLILDSSASMDYSSGAVDKFTYARMLAACILTLAHDQRDQVGLAAYGEGLQAYLPPRYRRGQLGLALAELANLRPGGATDSGDALGHLGQTLPAGGMVVLISDLLHPLDPLLDQLRLLRAQRHDVLVLQVSDPAEVSFPFAGDITLRDAEDGRRRWAGDATLRQAYLANRARHFDQIGQVCRAAEIDLEEFTTDQPLDRALRRFLNRRNRARLNSSRRSSVKGEKR